MWGSNTDVRRSLSTPWFQSQGVNPSMWTCSPAQGQAVTLELHKEVPPMRSDLRSLQHLCQGAFSCRDNKPTWALLCCSKGLHSGDVLSSGNITEFIMKCRIFLNRKLQGLPGNVCKVLNFSFVPGWAWGARQDDILGRRERWAGAVSTVFVMPLICLHLQFVLHSSKLGQLRCRQTLSAMRAALSSAELMLAAGSGDCAGWSASCPAMGSCSWLSSLEASPPPHSPCGPLRAAAVSCNQHWESSLPPASAPALQCRHGFLTASAAPVANFGRRQGRKLEGALMLGPYWQGYNFSKQSKTLYRNSTVLSHL